MDNIVSISECKDYDKVSLKNAIRSSLIPLGGMNAFVKSGQRVALKPNLLKPSSPEKAVTTHPVFVETVAELVIECGGKPFVVDSPGAGYLYTPLMLRRLYKKCGYRNLLSADSYLNFDCSFTDIDFPSGSVLKRFEILAPIKASDVIINLPKVKTHAFTYLTCSVKNLFGIIPGSFKSAYHGKFQDQYAFSHMLIDIYNAISPSLTIADGIEGMEGDGPSGGKKKILGLILASINPLILDMIIGHIIGFDHHKIPYLKIASDKGLCPKDIDSIRIISDKDLKALRMPFIPPASFFEGFNTKGQRLKRYILLQVVCTISKILLSTKPVINRSTCIGCGICAVSCPKKAIGIINKKAKIDYTRCIRCYCCHELCPKESISLKSPPLSRLLKRISRSHTD